LSHKLLHKNEVLSLMQNNETAEKINSDINNKINNEINDGDQLAREN
jgi:hypothetical protein